MLFLKIRIIIVYDTTQANTPNGRVAYLMIVDIKETWLYLNPWLVNRDVDMMADCGGMFRGTFYETFHEICRYCVCNGSCVLP